MPDRQDIQPNQFKQLFIDDVPLLDVRAPIEFAKGAFPLASNVPLLDNEQRDIIGKVYAADGQDSAIAKGEQLATPGIRSTRLQHWGAYLADNPDACLYCFRGGLRSRISQQWLSEAGSDYPKVVGGFKALRGYLLGELQRLAEPELGGAKSKPDPGTAVLLLAGATANGKTDLIHKWPQSLDLEGRANHRGSAFGATFSPQPAQISFENTIAIDWLKCEARAQQPVLVEAESRLVGRLNVPLPLQAAMHDAPVIELRCPREQRLLRLRNDYIEFALQRLQHSEADHWQALHDYILAALERIKKRLGGVQHKALTILLPEAVHALRDQNSWAGFDSMFELLLDHYYDKMYAYQLEQQKDRVVFRGNHDEVLQWLKHESVNSVMNESVGGVHAQ